jgi:hypothetical protein
MTPRAPRFRKVNPFKCCNIVATPSEKPGLPINKTSTDRIQSLRSRTLNCT